MVISKTFSNEPAQKRKRPFITLLLSISLILLIKTYIFGKRPFLNSPTLDESESKRETIRLNDQLNSAINTSLVQESKKRKYYVLNEWLQLSDAYERALTWSLNKRFQLNPAYKDKTFKICFFATFYQVLYRFNFLHFEYSIKMKMTDLTTIGSMGQENCRTLIFQFGVQVLLAGIRRYLPLRIL